MTNEQLYRSIGIPSLIGIGNFVLIVLAWIFNNKRIDDTNTNLVKRIEDNKESILAEMKAFRVEMLSEFRRLEDKIDQQMEQHLAEYHK